MGNKSMKQLGERPLEHPLALSGTAEIIAVQSVPESRLAVLETTGRVYQNDFNKTVVGWVDALGNAYRNDYNRTLMGRVDLATGIIYAADYNKTQLGHVDAQGNITCSSSVVHASATDVVIGRIEGSSDSYLFAACAFFTLFG